ncbi:MAG: hypothetical protein V9E82_02065 [Candidatus Nanopelagicales bacterium]
MIVTTPWKTWCDLGGVLELPALVAVTDLLLRQWAAHPLGADRPTVGLPGSSQQVRRAAELGNDPTTATWCGNPMNPRPHDQQGSPTG